MANNSLDSGFGVFGSPTVSQQALLEDRLARAALQSGNRRAIAQANATEDAASSPSASFFDDPRPVTRSGVTEARMVAAGRRAGRGIQEMIDAARAKNAPLTEDERRAIRIKAIAKARVGAQLLQPGPGTPGTESDEQKAARQMAENDPTTLLKMNLKALSLAAFQEDDLEQGLQFQQQLEQVREQEIVKAKSLQDLGDGALQRKIDTQELEQAKLDFKESVWDFDQKKLQLPAGDVRNIYSLEGANLGAGVVREDGSALTKDNKVLAVGEYSLVNPKAGSGGSATKINDFITTTDMGGVRAQQEAIFSLAGTAMQGLEAMQDSVDATGTINILGSGGAISSGFVRFIDNVSLLARLVTPEGTGQLEITNQGGLLPFQTAPDLNTRKGIEKYVEINGDGLADRWENFMPDSVRRNSAARDKWLSAIVQAGMARARIFEPTAKSLSDDDFQRGLDSIAGATTDPRAFQQIFFGAITRDLDVFDQVKKNLPINPNTGKSLLDDIINPAGQARFKKRMDEFKAAFDPETVDFGSGGNPGNAFQQKLTPTGETAGNPQTGERWRKMSDGSWEEISQ